MFRRSVAGVLAVVALTACGSESSSTSEETIAPVGKCSPTVNNPTLGMAAINRDYRVVVWNDPSSKSPVTLEQIGDDPFSENTGADLTVVETVAVSPTTCEVFIGACCEPVSGITFYDKQGDGEWETLFGHLPTISPDGELLARVAYEELLVSSLDNPEETMVTIGLPKADRATIYRAQWINGDEIALSGFTNNAAQLWIGRMSDGTLREGTTLSSDVTWSSDKMWRVGLVGVDELGNVVTQSINNDSGVVEFRYPESLEIFSTDDLPKNVTSYVVSQSRSVMVNDAGVLTTWFGNGDPKTVEGQFVWAS
jgi:hypothetical protein